MFILYHVLLVGYSLGRLQKKNSWHTGWMAYFSFEMKYKKSFIIFRIAAGRTDSIHSLALPLYVYVSSVPRHNKTRASEGNKQEKKKINQIFARPQFSLHHARLAWLGK